MALIDNGLPRLKRMPRKKIETMTDAQFTQFMDSYSMDIHQTAEALTIRSFSKMTPEMLRELDTFMKEDE